MVVLRPESEFGHAPPPQTPYSIVTNLPGWDVARTIRDGDMSALSRIVHIYPRFSPTHYAAEVPSLPSLRVVLRRVFPR